MRQTCVMHPFPIRIFDRGWHVLMAKPQGWIRCGNRHDARLLSRSQVLINQAAANRRGGKQFSIELRTAAIVLDRHGMHFIADLCRFYAIGHQSMVPLATTPLRKPR